MQVLVLSQDGTRLFELLGLCGIVSYNVTGNGRRECGRKTEKITIRIYVERLRIMRTTINLAAKTIRSI